MTFEVIAERLRVRPSGPGRSRGKCPVHGGKSLGSLSVSRGEAGKTLLKCWNGCTVEAICGAAGLKVSDLFERSDPARSREKPQSEHVQKAVRDLWPRLTPRERLTLEPIVIETSSKNLDTAIVQALAMGAEGDLVQIVMVEGEK